MERLVLYHLVSPTAVGLLPPAQPVNSLRLDVESSPVPKSGRYILVLDGLQAVDCLWRGKDEEVDAGRKGEKGNIWNSLTH